MLVLGARDMMVHLEPMRVDVGDLPDAPRGVGHSFAAAAVPLVPAIKRVGDEGFIRHVRKGVTSVTDIVGRLREDEGGGGSLRAG